MGVYNEYYKKYYSDINKKKGDESKGPRYQSSHNVDGRKSGSFPILINVFGKSYLTIFTVQAVIVLVMILAIIGAKVFDNPIAQNMYKTGLHYIDVGIFEDDSVVKDKAEDVFNYIKSILSIDKEHESYIYNNYSIPVKNDCIKSASDNDGKLVLTLNGEQNVTPSFSGVVKNIEGENIKNILIDHGNGVEIAYGGLDGVEVKKGDEVTVDTVLGKVNGDKVNLTLIVYYMGSRLNPEKCFKIEGV